MNNNNFSISYAYLACNEYKELKQSLDFIQQVKNEQDEIVILLDKSNYDNKILDYIYDYADIVEFYPLEKNFGRQKNKLIELCSKDYILNLDADEYITINDLKLLYKILELNTNTDLFYFPRYNIVDGITLNHINHWNWKISKEEQIKGMLFKNSKENYNYNINEYIKLLKQYKLILNEDENTIEYYKPLINYPDLQGRLWKNNGIIHWKKKVHEKLVGFKSIASLPVHIQHHKEINKQEQQNKFYSTI